DRLGRANLADSERTDRREALAGQDRTDYAGQVVRIADGSEHAVDAFIRLLRARAGRRLLLLASFRVGLRPRRTGPDRRGVPRQGPNHPGAPNHDGPREKRGRAT